MAPLPIDRIAADRPYCSGKHKKHGMNVQVLAGPFGRLLWASAALPGAVHDVKAARTHGIIDALTHAGIRCWADKGYRLVSHAKIRAVVEQAMVTLNQWRLLQKLRCSTTRITDIVKAVLALHPATSAGGGCDCERSVAGALGSALGRHSVTIRSGTSGIRTAWPSLDSGGSGHHAWMTGVSGSCCRQASLRRQPRRRPYC